MMERYQVLRRPEEKSARKGKTANVPQAVISSGRKGGFATLVESPAKKPGVKAQEPTHGLNGGRGQWQKEKIKGKKRINQSDRFKVGQSPN